MAFQILGPLSKRMAVAAALVLAIMAALVVTPRTTAGTAAVG
jgi:hypothetical protein